MLLNCMFVVFGDFNVPGNNVEQLNSQAVDLFSLYNQRQQRQRSNVRQRQRPDLLAGW